MADKKDKPKIKFEIRKLNLLALWSYDVQSDTCAICKSNIMSSCIECQVKNMNEVNNDCTISWGECNHVYHFHCISKWLKTRNVCPLDNLEWNFQLNK